MSRLKEVLEKAKKKTKSQQRTVKPEPGKTIWRVLPGWRKDFPELFYQPFGVHYIRGLDKQVKVVAICADKTHDQRCVVCEAISKAKANANSQEEADIIDEGRATQRFLVNAFRPDKDDKTPVVLELGKQLFDQLVDNIDEYENLFDPEEGNDIVITREGQGMNTSYTMTVRSATKSKPVPKSVLAQIHDLDEFVKTEEEIAKKALGIIDDEFGGVLPAGARKALSKPIEDDIPDDLKGETESDDEDEVDEAEIVDEAEKEEDEPKTEKASKKEKAAAEAEFDDEISDSDLEDMLSELD